MVIQNTYPNLNNIVDTDFELGRVIQTVGAADPGITDLGAQFEHAVAVRPNWAHTRVLLGTVMRELGTEFAFLVAITGAILHQ